MRGPEGPFDRLDRFPFALPAPDDFAQTALQSEVAALLVEALNLDVAPETIDPEAPLYGEGLGLDSIDILEVALVVSQRYGFQCAPTTRKRAHLQVAGEPRRSRRRPPKELRTPMGARLIAAGAAAAAYVLGSHWLMTGAPASPWNAASSSARCSARRPPAWQRRRRRSRRSPALATAALVVQAWRGDAPPPESIYVGQHVAIHVVLAFVFGLTLQGRARAAGDGARATRPTAA